MNYNLYLKLYIVYVHIIMKNHQLLPQVIQENCGPSDIPEIVHRIHSHFIT